VPFEVVQLKPERLDAPAALAEAAPRVREQRRRPVPRGRARRVHRAEQRVRGDGASPKRRITPSRLLTKRPGAAAAFHAGTAWDGGEPHYTDPRVDWVIVGGESGAGARPCDVHWIADILAQCDFAGVPAFVKQLGALPGFKPEDEWARGNTMPSFHHYDAPSGLHIKKMGDRHGSIMVEWPEELRVREFPASGVRA
jgi:hypothetical protein